MKENTSLNPAPDEKMTAALAHFFGPIAALFVWAFQKDKSRFAKFQALQALCFDFATTVTMGILFFCFFGIIVAGGMGSMFGILNSNPEDAAPLFILPFVFPFLMFGCVMPFSFLLMIPRIIASVSILNGRDFRYPIIGKWLEKFLAE